MNSDHIKAAMIVFDMYGKNPYVEAERKLDACMSFMKFFAKDREFNRVAFFKACMFGTIIEAVGQEVA